MTDDRNTHNQTQNPSHSQCQQHKNYYVLIQLNDGRQLDGIITDVTKDQIEMLVSESADDSGRTSVWRTVWLPSLSPELLPDCWACFPSLTSIHSSLPVL